MKKLFVLCLTLSISFSQTLDGVIEYTFTHSPLIKERISEIESLQHKRDLESTYKNPILTLGANDLLLSDFFNRELEPMQTHFITLSQELDTNGKLGLQKSLIQTKIATSQLGLLDLKLSLIKEIKTLNQEILIKENILSLQTQKLENLKKMKAYHHNTINTQDL